MNEGLMNLLSGIGGDENNKDILASMLPAMLPGLLSTVLGDPQMMQEIISNTVAQYRPVVYTALEELFAAYEDLANNERVFKAQASMKYNTYKAYIDAGFTSEQATLFLVDSDSARKRILNQIVSVGNSVQSS